MRHLIIAKQPNSKMCLVCGLKNPFGLRAAFYELDNRELLAIFRPRPEHQGYPGRLHGGIATAILDETIGRAVMHHHAGEAVWGVTIEITTRFKQAVPIDEELRVVGRLTEEGRRSFAGSGEILLADGSVAVTGQGRYMKLPLSRIADFDEKAQEWRVVADPADPRFLDI